MRLHLKSKVVLAAFGGLLLLLCASLYLNVFLYRNHSALDRLYSQKGTVVLTPSLTEDLISALETQDPTVLQSWRAFLKQSVALESASVWTVGVQEAFDLYRLNESPRRSNYFARLVFELNLKQQTNSLSKQALVNYLGQPDVSEGDSNDEVLTYVYNYAETDSKVFFSLSNNIVREIGYR
jgi:hypothetical protein